MSTLSKSLARLDGAGEEERPVTRATFSRAEPFVEIKKAG